LIVRIKDKKRGGTTEERVTVLPCVNIDGSDKWVQIVVGKKIIETALL
jgi:hypothetical protein